MDFASLEAAIGRDLTAAEKFALEVEAVVLKYTPGLTAAADAAEVVTGNPELVPITNAAAGAAEAAMTAAQDAQNGQLAAAVAPIASAVSSVKTAISATHQVAAASTGS